MEYYATTDIGRHRQNNEDAYSIDEENSLFIVCDGVGGNNAGEVAAQVTCKTICQYIQEHSEILTNYKSGHKKLAPIKKLVTDAISAANDEVYRLSTNDKKLKNMACTMTMLMRLGRRIVTAHIGDSRIYMYRNEEVHIITEDHTVAQDLVNRGLADEEALHGPMGNVLSKTIGLETLAEPDIEFITLEKGDRFILCSDGLTRYVPNPAPLCCYFKKTAEQASKGLLSFCLEKGGHDNITIISLFSK